MQGNAERRSGYSWLSMRREEGERRKSNVRRGWLRFWSVVALVSGIGWIVVSHPPVLTSVAVVVVSLVLGALAWAA